MVWFSLTSEYFHLDSWPAWGKEKGYVIYMDWLPVSLIDLPTYEKGNSLATLTEND